MALCEMTIDWAAMMRLFLAAVTLMCAASTLPFVIE